MSSDIETSKGDGLLGSDHATIFCRGLWNLSCLRTAQVCSKDAQVPTKTETSVRFVDASVQIRGNSQPLYYSPSSLSHRFEQLRWIFRELYFPIASLEQAPSSQTTAQMNPTGDWLSQVGTRVANSHSLDYTTAACAALHVGRNRQDANLVCQGHALYEQGLLLLQEALVGHKTRLDDATLATCMALSMYEVGSDITETVWISRHEAHIRGALTLMQMRGPQNLVSPLAHSIFLALRRQIVRTRAYLRTPGNCKLHADYANRFKPAFLGI